MQRGFKEVNFGMTKLESLQILVLVQNEKYSCQKIENFRISEVCKPV
jgi:hypothetical protein